ncbi:homeobox protein Hox-D9-like isoform X2 [Pipistrellus kuhlii]|uniref:homeobox protein Hox-D9-like isoform X2 n=1 Tax=Pipistrellus kuhlii TaxID=59472 RepID=UPI00174ED1CF|nr:homeobox protein Hox-D9-like isoform X2 [Pipistrellus kuhlii]
MDWVLPSDQPSPRGGGGGGGGGGPGRPRPAGAAEAAVTSRRCSERARSHRRQPGPATRRKEGTGRSRWCCGKWQEREAGTHLEAPRPRCRASCAAAAAAAARRRPPGQVQWRGWRAATAAAPPRVARGDRLREEERKGEGERERETSMMNIIYRLSHEHSLLGIEPAT